ncbi:MAG TPA: malectin domain-containing carbohydrate-binding protein, partial [Planctomycetota bacterium]|nr:malectin domain-containing carbohydrate-binding protein [Planctomycetota bacterium]
LDQWQARPSLPEPRGSGGLFVVGRELHFVGGVDVDRDTDKADHWVLDLDNPVDWSASTPLPVARNHFGCIGFNGRGYVLGGQQHHDVFPLEVALVHVWDPALGWLAGAPLPYPRSHFEPSLSEFGGSLVLAGGRSIPMGWLNLPEVLAYDPQADDWSLIGLLPQSLIAPCLKVIGGEFLLSGGGVDVNQPFSTTQRRVATLGQPDTLRFNSGGGVLGLSQSWCEGAGEFGGKDFVNGSVGDIAGTLDDPLFVAQRTGDDAQPDYLGVRMPMADGSYVLQLHFAETYWGASGGAGGGVGKRVFDVRAEGVLLQDDLDITAAVGASTALLTTHAVEVEGGLLDLDLNASIDRPLLAGLELLAVDSDGAYCVGAPNSVGPGARMGSAGSTSIAEDDLVLVTFGCPPDTVGLYLQSATQAQVPLFDGFLCVGSPFWRLTPGQASDAAGSAVRPFALQSPDPPHTVVAAGETWHFQLWYRDPALGSANFSDGLSLTFEP